MRTPSACSSFTSLEPARNQRSSPSTERNASRFVVTAGKPSAMSKRMTSPKIARVPTPVRSARSTPLSIALRRIARYWRTTLGLRSAVHASADAHVAHVAVVVQELAPRVLHRPVEKGELVRRREGHTRWRRVLRRRVVLQLVVRVRLVDEPGVGDLETRVRELSGPVPGKARVPVAAQFDVDGLGLLDPEVALLPPLRDLGMQERTAHGVRLHGYRGVALRREHEHALLSDGDAAVVLQAHAMDVAQEPRDTHLAIEVRVRLRGAHALEVRLRQQTRAVRRGPVAEMEARVAHEVPHRRHDTAHRRRRARESPWAYDARLLVGDLVAYRHAVHDRLAGVEDRARHSKGPQQQLARRLLVRLAGDHFDDPPKHRERGVRVVPDLAERRDLLEVDHRVDVPREGVVAATEVGEAVAEPSARMRDEVLHRRA